MNIADILAIKFPFADFTKDILLGDDGDGVIDIKAWNLSTSIPTQEDIDNWASEFDLQYRQQQAVLKRKYPPIQEQLDMIYHDKIENTTVWLDTLSAIKENNPIPTEIINVK